MSLAKIDNVKYLINKIFLFAKCYLCENVGHWLFAKKNPPAKLDIFTVDLFCAAFVPRLNDSYVVMYLIRTVVKLFFTISKLVIKLFI